MLGLRLLDWSVNALWLWCMASSGWQMGGWVV
jgi:hypothetical protein